MLERCETGIGKEKNCEIYLLTTDHATIKLKAMITFEIVQAQTKID